ncbi:MAG: amino acid ABC transporter permease [Actinomycetota bacterium]|nr:amino acid ABC transporter permease [Actinomycetota bacterium]
MAIAEPAVEQPQPPDTRGPTAPLPLGVLLAGAASLTAVVVGSIVVQIAYALFGGDVTQKCLADGLGHATVSGTKISFKPIEGARGLCHIVQGFTSATETVILFGAIALGAAAIVVGFSIYKKMPNKRQREHAIAGAALGIQGIVLSAVLLWFRSGELTTFAQNFFNFQVLHGHLGAFLTGMRNTIVLAFGGEIGGILIGLMLAMLALSSRKVVRAPARTYINFFRGTPLIWQLSVFYFGLALGLRLNLSAFQVALIVFSLNTGAYSAEVFRAGIQSIERGQMEAARSLGMTYGQAMRFAIVPQAVRRVIPPLMNEFVILIKDTSLIVVLGLTLSQRDIFSVGQDLYSSSFNATSFVAVAVGYLVVTLPLIRVVNAVERRLRSGLTGIVGL